MARKTSNDGRKALNENQKASEDGKKGSKRWAARQQMNVHKASDD